MKCQEFYSKFLHRSGHLKSLSLLLTRLTLAYGFYSPAMIKWADINSVAQWFDSLGIPFASLSAYLIATAELAGVVLLTLGFFTRLISLVLIVGMFVAIVAVHLNNGFSAGSDGFEIPLYYILFLLLFVSHGAGKFSLDYFSLERKRKYKL
ncbi:MAG: DoxX family protein [Sulfurimonas sp.]|nr:DoxX family protein [Sulfurimonas sp.]